MINCITFLPNACCCFWRGSKKYRMEFGIQNMLSVAACPLANFNRPFKWTPFSSGVVLGCRTCNSAPLKILDTVIKVTWMPSSARCFASVFLLPAAYFKPIQRSLGPLERELLRERPHLGRFTGEQNDLYIFIIDWIIDFETLNCSHIFV